ncbi:MAG TPA: tetratricopeptide repeat protein [Thermoanaerobaculia bacterium]|nr:tetratricopeptide repeat protein [Thermoanaerobaculia bacterium]
MCRIRFFFLAGTLGVAVGLATFACAKKEAPAPVVQAQTPTPPSNGGKIPVTTASAEAKSEFLQGRDLAEKLRITDSHEHFEKAASLDPHFALAELNLANSAPTGKEFFEHLGKAVSLADGASNGEKLLILATEAGANNNPAKQKEYLDQLVGAYPNDERAHFNLGGYYFGQQDFPQAIEHYRKATEIAPSYSSAWNLLGYAYRQNVDYPNAEKAFQKYIELIPGDPNPYDSYAELLLKEGKFDDSITQYRKALSIDPNFLASHQGIAMDLLYSGKAAQALAELDNIAKKARNDGETRTGLFATTVVHVDQGQWAKALADVDEQYALGEKTGDVPAMAGDLNLKGNILLETGKSADALASFERALKTIEDSNLSREIKDNNRRLIHFNRARVAIARKDFATAKTEAEEFQKGAEASNNPNQVKLAHELTGQIALAEKDWDKALAELQQANQQNPQNLYRMCQAHQGKGEKEKASGLCSKAAGFNSLPQLNYAFIRGKAKGATRAS